MAEKAIKLLGNEELLAEFSQNAYRKAKEFALENVLPMYEQLYCTIVDCSKLALKQKELVEK